MREHLEKSSRVWNDPEEFIRSFEFYLENQLIHQSTGGKAIFLATFVPFNRVERVIAKIKMAMKLGVVAASHLVGHN